MADFDITRIAGNIGAMNALNSLQNINKQLSIHQTRLSTGKRINSAADDPAGLTIATKMNSRSEGLKTALDNIGDAKNLLSVAESGLGRINDILVQMQNKSESAASDTMGSAERDAIVTQLTAYSAQIDDIATQTQWNGKNLIDGTTGTLSFQTGAGKDDVTDVDSLSNMSATGTGSLNLAKKATATDVASFSDDATKAIVSGSEDVAFGDATNTDDLTQLASGTYSVKLEMTSATAGKIHLFGSDGKELEVGASGSTSTTGLAVDLSSGDKTIDFGNGLSIKVEQKIGGTTDRAADDVSTASVTVEHKGDYSMGFTDSDGNDVVLTKDSSASDFRSYMAYVGTKLDSVSGELAKIGALTGRLDFKEDQVSDQQVNVQAAYDRIMDADMADEQVNASKYQILQQTAVAMLAQANTAPQYLLSLFK